MRLLLIYLKPQIAVCLLMLVGLAGCQTGRQAMMSQQQESQYQVPPMQLTSASDSSGGKQVVETAGAFEEQQAEPTGPDKWSKMLDRFKLTPFKPIPTTATLPPAQTGLTQNMPEREAF